MHHYGHLHSFKGIWVQCPLFWLSLVKFPEWDYSWMTQSKQWSEKLKLSLSVSTQMCDVWADLHPGVANHCQCWAGQHQIKGDYPQRPHLKILSQNFDTITSASNVFYLAFIHELASLVSGSVQHQKDAIRTADSACFVTIPKCFMSQQGQYISIKNSALLFHPYDNINNLLQTISVTNTIGVIKRFSHHNCYMAMKINIQW